MPVRINSNKFCCCFPVRLGVIIIAVLGVVLGGIIVVGGIIQHSCLGGDIKNKLPYVLQIVVYGLYAILSLGGLVGAGSLSVYQYFKDAPDSVRSCANGSQDDLVVEACQKGVSMMKGVLIGVFLFVWLMEIWGCVIIKSYRRQLEDEVEVKAFANRQ